jgi:hypothetical protein
MVLEGIIPQLGGRHFLQVNVCHSFLLFLEPQDVCLSLWILIGNASDCQFE